MANLDRPFGFEPWGEPLEPPTRYSVDASASTIYKGDPVKMENDGYVAPASAGERLLGIAAGYHESGTAGNVGVTLFKPLTFFQGPQFVPNGQHIEPLSALYGALVSPGAEACIEVLSFGGSSSLLFTGGIKLLEV